MNFDIDVSGVVLETERLILREFKESDVNDFYEYAKVDGVGQMAGWCPHKDLEESKKILNMFIKGKRTFAIVYKENMKVIGSIGLEVLRQVRFSNNLKGREIGYVLSKDYWGHGLAPEGAKCVMNYCFNVLHADYLLVGHFVSNHQSERVIQKCGFHYLCNIDYETHFNTIEDCKMYFINKEEWHY